MKRLGLRLVILTALTIGSGAAATATTCSGWARELSVHSDGTVSIYSNARLATVGFW